jgi:hypothetical protein
MDIVDLRSPAHMATLRTMVIPTTDTCDSNVLYRCKAPDCMALRSTSVVRDKLPDTQQLEAAAGILSDHNLRLRVLQRDDVPHHPPLFAPTFGCSNLTNPPSPTNL